MSQSWPESNSREEIFHIPQSSRSVISPSDGLLSYTEQLLCGVLTSSNSATSSKHTNNTLPSLSLVVKAMDGGIIVSEFELQSRYYVYFRANTIGKCMNPLILPFMG